MHSVNGRDVYARAVSVRRANALQLTIAYPGGVEVPPKNTPFRSRRGFCTASLGRTGIVIRMEQNHHEHQHQQPL